MMMTSKWGFITYKQQKPKQLKDVEWDECINSYNEPEPRSKWWARTAYILLLASAFLLGRAYGWYEVHLFIKHNAEGLAALAGTLK